MNNSTANILPVSLLVVQGRLIIKTPHPLGGGFICSEIVNSTLGGFLLASRSI